MNTFDRHRQYLLRRQRTRRLRRRVLTAVAACLVLLVVWDLAARFAPSSVAPPDPARIGTDAARDAAHAAAVSINRVHTGLRPGYRDAAKRAVLRKAAPVESPSGGTATCGTWPGGITPGETLTAQGIPPRPCAMWGNTLADSLPVGTPKGAARTLDILLIGTDSRLGRGRGRADALQLLTIDVVTPVVRITGIPRGTPSALGYEDDASNIISNVLAARGRGELQRRVAALCGRDSVPYYVQVGFSDAIGVLHLLGFDDPVAGLQSLRKRRGYRYGDHNRCYHQGLFVREALIRALPLLEGATGELLLRAGIDLLETNLTPDLCRGIVYLLNDAGVGRMHDRIEVTLHSRFRDLIVGEHSPRPFAFGGRADGGQRTTGDTGPAAECDRAERRIRTALADAQRVRTQPARVRSLLWTMFSQHAWLQLGEDSDRRALRDSLAVCLLDACTLLGDTSGTGRIRRVLQADDVLFPPGRRRASSDAVSIR